MENEGKAGHQGHENFGPGQHPVHQGDAKLLCQNDEIGEGSQGGKTEGNLREEGGNANKNKLTSKRTGYPNKEQVIRQKNRLSPRAPAGGIGRETAIEYGPERLPPYHTISQSANN